MMNADNSVAARLGSFLNLAATAIRSYRQSLKNIGLVYLTNADLIRPDAGGVADAFIDSLFGNEPNTNAYSSWIDKTNQVTDMTLQLTNFLM